MTARLDVALVRRGLARSRTQAQALVRAEVVLLDGRVVTKASTTVADHQQLSLTPADPFGEEARWIVHGYVGRGALKLRHALLTWAPRGLTVESRRCLDIGASTGGFTQVLLEEGAREVIALDVGHGQLAEQVRAHPAVRDLSGTNIRDTSTADLGGPVEVIVGDLSFISLTHVIPVLPGLIAVDSAVSEGAGGGEHESSAEIVLLVKPQFEVGADRLGRGGIVRSAALRHDALTRIADLGRAHGLIPMDVERSPVTGGVEGEGNIEYLLWLRPCRSSMMDLGPSPQDWAARCAELRMEEER
ncbi:TlyA family RNA methyltransferase [Ornithinimicrobium sp. Y1847]|uniref:TlyA family RNA methyltransferase n=1 Tax=Ornithinimicrobium sp. Y1847 TaxID=3405419 RepID=UPI003B6784BE